MLQKYEKSHILSMQFIKKMLFLWNEASYYLFFYYICTM